MPLTDYQAMLASAPMERLAPETLARCVDAVIEQQGVSAAELVGIAPRTYFHGCWVVHPAWVIWADERGAFRKRVEIGAKKSLERVVRTAIDLERIGGPAHDLSYVIIGEDRERNEVIRLVYDTSARTTEHIDPLYAKQADYLYDLIKKAIA